MSRLSFVDGVKNLVRPSINPLSFSLFAESGRGSGSLSSGFDEEAVVPVESESDPLDAFASCCLTSLVTRVFVFLTLVTVFVLTELLDNSLVSVFSPFVLSGEDNIGTNDVARGCKLTTDSFLD